MGGCHRGFDLVCPGFDVGHIMGSAAQELARARQAGGSGGGKTPGAGY